MAVKIDEMVAELRLTLDKFSAPLKKAEQQAKKSSGKMKRAFDVVSRSVTSLKSKVFSLKAAFIGLGAAIAIRGIKNTLNMADSIGKVAKAAGISTDALQKYQFAAEQSGVQTQALNKSLLGFNIRIGELKQGRGLLFTFLETYDKGFQKALAATTTTEEALKLMFEALAKVKDGATLASLNMAAFGGAALKMTNLIKDGIGPFNELIAQAERFGIIIDSRFIKAAESTNDKLNIMAKILRVVKTEIVFALIPVMQKLADSFRDNRKTIAEVTKGLAFIATGLGKILAFIGNNPVISSVGILGFVLLGTVGKVLLIGTIVLLKRIQGIIAEMNANPDRAAARAITEREKALARIKTALEKNIVQLRATQVEIVVNGMLSKISASESEKGEKRLAILLKARRDALAEINQQLKFIKASEDLAFIAAQQGRFPGTKEKPVPSGADGRPKAPAGTPGANGPQEETPQQEAARAVLEFEQELVAAQLQIAFDREEALTKIANEGARKRLEFQRMTGFQQVRNVLGTLSRVLQGSQQSNKKLFQLQKIAGVASATINAFKGAGETLGAYPQPLASVLAGVHLATGLANARNIAKQSFSGSVGGGSIGGGGSAPSIPSTPSSPIAQDQARQGPQQRIEIFVKGEVFTAQVLDDVIDGINDRVGNNVELVATRVA